LVAYLAVFVGQFTQWGELRLSERVRCCPPCRPLRSVPGKRVTRMSQRRCRLWLGRPYNIRSSPRLRTGLAGGRYRQTTAGFWVGIARSPPFNSWAIRRPCANPSERAVPFPTPRRRGQADPIQAISLRSHFTSHHGRPDGLSLRKRLIGYGRVPLRGCWARLPSLWNHSIH
jgi:hypothetical protein